MIVAFPGHSHLLIKTIFWGRNKIVYLVKFEIVKCVKSLPHICVTSLKLDCRTWMSSFISL